MLEDFAEIGEMPYSETDAEWDAFVANHPHGSVLQTTNWARLKSRFGWTATRVWAREDGNLVAGAQILFKSAMRVVKIGYIPHGPLVDWQNDEMVDVLLNRIDAAMYTNRASLLKMEPMVWQGSDSAEKAFPAVIQRHSLITDTDTIQPPRTMLIDLTPDEDGILASFKSKTRYNIRLAAKKEVTVREGTMADIPTFTKMVQTTGQRNAFGVHTPKYYEAAFEIFSPSGNVALLIAEYEGKPLAGAMIFKNGPQATYLYGASNNEERNRMPTYAVQWAAMQWSKRNGCTFYDMWGLPDAPPDQLEAEFKERNDGLWGVYRFKRGFQGQVARTVGCADKSYNRLVYHLYQRRRNRS